MRPVRRGTSPQAGYFNPYDDAKADLVSRLGPYCSYCERRIATNLAVEHIQPKSAYPELQGTWTNFLLGCINCNSTKSDKDFKLLDVLLPDRDNTFDAYRYGEDGTIQVSAHLTTAQQKKAHATLSLVGLDRPPLDTLNTNGVAVALDRVRQRQEAWVVASEARQAHEQQPDNAVLRLTIEALAQSTGFFSVWMSVFEGLDAMRVGLISVFKGTLESGCFDATSALVRPAPNKDKLPAGGKV